MDTIFDYTTRPTHVRLYSESYPDGNVEWFIDGADDDGNYTEACWSYDSYGEAVANLADFVEVQTTHAGVVWDWRPQRNK